MTREQTKVVTTNQGNSIPADVVDARLHQLEAAYDLLQYEIEGWCAWPMLRSPVALTLMNIPLAKKEALGVGELLPIVIKDIMGLMSLPRTRYLAKTYTSALAEQEGSYYKDIFFDDLLPALGDYLKIELMNNKYFISRSKSALIKSNITLTSFRVAANLLAKVNGPRHISNLAETFSLCLTKGLEVHVFTPRWTRRVLWRFYWYKALFGWLLDRVRPEWLLLADAGEYEITAAAKERGIKVIEFQHGFVSAKHHILYSWPAHAAAYKTKMPIPDRILLYGDHWKQELEANGFWAEELCSVGSLRLDQYHQRRFMSKAGIKDSPVIIVLTTQGVDTERVIAFVADFLKSATRRLEFYIYIKLHPVFETSKDLYEVAFQADQRVRILLGSEAPSTFELLAQADFHLSISSTCHYEALGLGVPTVILPFATYEVVLPLHEVGHAFVAQTPEDLLGIILQNRQHQVPIEISAFYFKPNALENIKRELNLPRI